MFRVFTQTKLIVLFYIIAMLVVVQGTYEWLSLKRLESSMPLSILEQNIKLSRVVFSLNQLEAIIDEVQLKATKENRAELIDALDFAFYSLEEYPASGGEDINPDLPAAHQKVMEVFRTMRDAIAAETIFEPHIIRSLHQRYREAIVPFPQRYFNQSERAFASLVQQTARISDFRNLTLSISSLLVLSLLIVALMGLSRQNSLKLLRKEQTERFHSEALLRSIVEYAPYVIYLKDLHGKYLLVNRAFARVHGLNIEECIGKSARDFYTLEQAEEHEDMDKSCCECDTSINYEMEYDDKDDPDIFSIIKFPIKDEEGNIIGTGGIDIDVSQHRYAVIELANQKVILESIVNHAPAAVYLKDLQGHYLLCNRSFCDWHGIDHRDVIGKTAGDFFTAEKAAFFNQKDQQCRDSLQVLEHDSSIEPGDGSIKSEHSIRFPILDNRGQLISTGGIDVDISERKQAEIALRMAKEQAESADRLKSAFLATMSHELRTPLNSIIGFSGILLQGLAGDLNEEQSKQLGMVKTSALHLLSLINDILDISKIEAGSMTADSDVFVLHEAIQNAINIVSPAAEMKSLELVLKEDLNIGEISSDRRRVEQILLNLLSNAIKFSEEGSISIETYLDKDSLRISISDTGIGVKQEDMGHLFQPFYQLDQRGSARKHEGTGLGLALSRRLAQILGGDITARSCWGEGSVFTLELPTDQQENTVA